MRTVCLLACVVVVGADSAIDYESKLREAFKEFQGKAEAIAKETKNRDPDRLVPALVTRRRVWVNNDDTGFFEQVHSGHWIERVPSGDAHLFVEVARKDAYVEVARTDGSAAVRLYENRCDVLFKGKKGFDTIYRGKWMEPE